MNKLVIVVGIMLIAGVATADINKQLTQVSAINILKTSKSTATSISSNLTLLRNRSLNSRVVVPKSAPPEASGEYAVSAVKVAVLMLEVPLSIAPNPDA